MRVFFFKNSIGLKMIHSKYKTGFQQCISLNGLWNFSPLDLPDPPKELPTVFYWEEKPFRTPSSWRWKLDHASTFQPYDLFNYPESWDRHPAAFLQKTFNVNKISGTRYKLVFEGVLQRWKFYINHIDCHECSLNSDQQVFFDKEKTINESFLPVEFDITDHLKNGLNEIILWCGPWERIHTPTGDKVLVPNGSWFANLARGPWGDVYINEFPDTSIDEVFIQTSTRKSRISLQVSVTNRKKNQFAGFIQTQVLNDTVSVLKYSHHRVNIPAGGKDTVNIAIDWPEPEYWSPDHPHLYVLECNLISDEEIIHNKKIRFGFREIWFDNHKFYINGIRTNLRGDAWHYQGFVFQTPEYARNWYRACKEAGVNFVRLHAMPYPEFFLDVADEEGMLVIDESAIYGSSKSTISDHPEFIKNCQTHLQRLVRRDRNHPSVIIWSMQNEMRWVDGRLGYLEAMPGLTQAMRSLDSTRAILYDGDNRLVSQNDCEIVSMHYNIDGTVAEWDRQKPLIFGEHGAYHYISPQTCTEFAGSSAYSAFSSCLENIAEDERLFIEYARREQVTGVTPFNMVNYSHWTIPDSDVSLQWEDLTTSGPKPERIPAHTVTINNGLVPGPMHTPNPAYYPVQLVFQPVIIIPDELNTIFYDMEIERNFSIYNDTEKTIPCQLEWKLMDKSIIFEQGNENFIHPAGERISWKHTFNFIDLLKKNHDASFNETESAPHEVVLELKLYHENQIKFNLEKNYLVYSSKIKKTPLVNSGKPIGYIGDPDEYQRISFLLNNLVHIEDFQSLLNITFDCLIVGSFNNSKKDGDIKNKLEVFVQQGGVVIILEQDDDASLRLQLSDVRNSNSGEPFTFGELSLSGRKFFTASPTNPDHPILAGFTHDHLRHWSGENSHQPGWTGLVHNAFTKPVSGDIEFILECGEGSFGWGGLQWTPLLTIRHGKGLVLFNQVSIRYFYEKVPQACLLLKNILNYAMNWSAKPYLYLHPLGSQADFIIHRLHHETSSTHSILLLDPDSLTEEILPDLNQQVHNGRSIFVLPSRPCHAVFLSQIAGVPIDISESVTYQLAPVMDYLAQGEILEGMSIHDLYTIEKVTYTPLTYTNYPIALFSVKIPGSNAILVSAVNPWHEFFIDGLDGEPVKMAIATINTLNPPERKVYLACLPVGKGKIYFCQVNLDLQKPKIIRFYSRIFSNLGIEIPTNLFFYQKKVQDHNINEMMGLPMAEHQDYQSMEAYFSDPLFSLNNLGEGVYGWMLRFETQNGKIIIPDSQNQVWFLTVFIHSDINRDPSLRESNILPDSSIVPDLYMEVNCPVKVYINGTLIKGVELKGMSRLKYPDILLKKGLNRLLIICYGNEEFININVWLQNKFNESVPGLRYYLTMD